MSLQSDWPLIKQKWLAGEPVEQLAQDANIHPEIIQARAARESWHQDWRQSQADLGQRVQKINERMCHMMEAMMSRLETSMPGWLIEDEKNQIHPLYKLLFQETLKKTLQQWQQKETVDPNSSTSDSMLRNLVEIDDFEIDRI